MRERFSKEEDSSSRVEENEIKVALSESVFEQLQKKLFDEFSSGEYTQLFDQYYDDENFTLTNLNRGLRLRSETDKPSLLEFKSLFYVPNIRPANPWFVEERSLKIPLETNDIAEVRNIFCRLNRSFQETNGLKLYDYDSVQNLLMHNGMEPRIVVRKDRYKIVYPSYDLCLDRVEGLGCFLEIETPGKQDPREILKSMSNMGTYEVVREGYNDMVMNKEEKILPVNVRAGFFKDNPSWNVLPGEEELIYRMLKNE